MKNQFHHSDYLAFENIMFLKCMALVHLQILQNKCTVHATIAERFLLRQYVLGDHMWAGITC